MTIPPYFVDAPVEGEERQRWRNPQWRQSAAETLLALGAGRCLSPGCGDDGAPHYCEEHESNVRSAVGVPQENPELVRRLHDAAVRRVIDLLGEVGELLGVPRD